MDYDRAWMGYGLVGGVEAGLISLVAALALFGVFHWIGRRNGWGYGPQIGWSFLLALLLTAGHDLADLFYFNYAPLQSLPLLQAKLAEVHDPDHMGLRALCEFLGVTLGVYLGWLLSQCGGWRRVFRRR